MRNILLLGVAALLSASCGPSASSAPQGPDKIGAWAACETFVEKRLKAPSSADFQSYAESQVEVTGATSFKVHGWVDAQNSFGAKLRSNYSCDLHSAGETWHLDAVSIE